MLSTACSHLGALFNILAISEHANLISVPEILKEKLLVREFNETCPDFEKFSKNLTEEIISKGKNNYRFDVKRFAHKIFAIHSAYHMTESEVLIWVDADVKFLKNIEQKALEKWLPEHAF